MHFESNRSYDLFRDSPGEQWEKPLKRQSGSPPGEWNARAMDLENSRYPSRTCKEDGGGGEKEKKKKKKIRQKWPDVDNPSTVTHGSWPKKTKRSWKRKRERKRERGREGDEESEEERRGCRWKMDDARFAERRRDTTPRSGRRLILFWKLGLAWPWQTRHLQIVYGDGPYPRATFAPLAIISRSLSRKVSRLVEWVAAGHRYHGRILRVPLSRVH